MTWSLLKVLKSAFLYSPFYNLYGSLYLNESSKEIIAIKTSYTNKFGYADFLITKNNEFAKSFTMNQKYEEISLKKFESRRGNTYLINDNSIFNHISTTNITYLVETYKMNEDKFKSSCYNIYDLDHKTNPKNLYRKNKPNTTHTTHTTHKLIPNIIPIVKANITYSYSYLKCSKSHLHLSKNIWPNIKFMGRIRKESRRKTIVSTCFDKCTRRGYNKYFAMDSGNICWCSNRNKEPPMKGVSNICLKCSDDIYSYCGNVNYGFMSIYQINSHTTHTINPINHIRSKSKRPSPTPDPTPSPTNILTTIPTNSPYVNTSNNTSNNTLPIQDINIIGKSGNYNSHIHNMSNYTSNTSNTYTSEKRNIIRVYDKNYTYNQNSQNSQNVSKKDIDLRNFSTSVNIKVFQNKLERILNVIDKKINKEKTKEEIVEIWNDFEEFDDWSDSYKDEEDEEEDED